MPWIAVVKFDGLRTPPAFRLRLKSNHRLTLLAGISDAPEPNGTFIHPKAGRAHETFFVAQPFRFGECHLIILRGPAAPRNRTTDPESAEAPIRPSRGGRVVAFLVLGGLHHD